MKTLAKNLQGHLKHQKKKHFILKKGKKNQRKGDQKNGIEQRGRRNVAKKVAKEEGELKNA